MAKKSQKKKTDLQKRFPESASWTTIKHRSSHTTVTRFTGTNHPTAMLKQTGSHGYQGYGLGNDRSFCGRLLRDLTGEKSSEQSKGASFRTKLGPWRAGDPRGTPQSLLFSFSLALFILFFLESLCVSSSFFFSTSLLLASWSYSDEPFLVALLALTRTLF